MPKITIKTLPLNESIDVPAVITKLGKALVKELSIRPHQFVILWELILPGHFLFNGQFADIQQSSTHHPIIDITAIEGMATDLEKRMVHILVRILSHELAVDADNICVAVNNLKPGKLFVMGSFKELPLQTG